MNDEYIISLFRQRDEAAIAELDKRYGRLCSSIAGNILSQREDVEECVNSAYYALWSSFPDNEPDDIQAYLCRTVKNIAINKLKYNNSEKRNSQLTVSLDELAECIPDRDSDEAEAKHLAEAISRFLRTQDDLHQKLFVRRYWYGDSIGKIAGYYGIKEKTAATYLYRTRKKLKAFLEKEGYYE